MRLDVRHDEKKKRFVAEVEGRESVLSYDRLDDTTLEYKHTFVPEDLRERGIASGLVRHALDWAAERDLEVVATCPFVRSYVQEHPEISGVTVPESA